MNFTSILRPAQKILTTSIVAAVTTTCLVSATNTTSASPDQGSHAKTSDSAKKEYRSVVTPDKKEYSATADVNLAKKEYLSVTPDKKEYSAAADLNLVDQSAYPALGTSTYETRVRYAVNRVRRAHHLRALTLATCTDRVANRWSAHLAATNSLYHQSMTGLLRTCGARYAGETLGRGSISPRTLVSMWMHSAPHRHILMSSSPRRIGIGATPNSRGEWVVAANFMRF